MKKISQLEEQLKKREEEIKNMYQESLKKLEESLKSEYQKTLNTIKEDTKLYQSEIVKQLNQGLQIIGRELEMCRTRKKWKWAIGGGIAGIIATLLILKFLTISYPVNYDGKKTVTAYTWTWQIPKQK